MSGLMDFVYTYVSEDETIARYFVLALIVSCFIAAVWIYKTNNTVNVYIGTAEEQMPIESI